MDKERIKKFFNPAEWGFSRYERLALALFIVLLIAGSLLRFNRHQTLSGYPPLTVEHADSTLADSLTVAVNDEPLHTGSHIPQNRKKGARKGKLAPGETININSAGIDQLIRLPGIGHKKAKTILDYRTAHGRFQSVDDLDNIKGFGPKTITKLRPLVRLNDP